MRHFTSNGIDMSRGPRFIEVQGACRLPGEWFACEYPERPLDEDGAFHDCCRSCLIAAEVAGVDALPVMRARLDGFGPAPRLNPQDAA